MPGMQAAPGKQQHASSSGGHGQGHASSSGRAKASAVGTISNGSSAAKGGANSRGGGGGGGKDAESQDAETGGGGGKSAVLLREVQARLVGQRQVRDQAVPTANSSGFACKALHALHARFFL